MPIKDPIQRAIYKRKWYEKNRPKILNHVRLYRIEHLTEIRQKKRDHYFLNRERYAEYKRLWRLKHRERLLQKSRLHYLKNKPRYQQWTRERKRFIRSLGNFDKRASQWHKMLMKYKYQCLRCHTTRKLFPDHVIPISKGGLNTIDNIQVLCDSCNRWKGRRIIDYRPHGITIGP